MAVPPGRTLCHGHQREAERGLTSSVAIAEVIEDTVDLPGPPCPCGGLAEAELHEASLTHIVWLSRQGSYKPPLPPSPVKRPR